jgi:hypothetical protein
MSQTSLQNILECSREPGHTRLLTMICTIPLSQVLSSGVLERPKAKRYSEKFTQEFVEVT